MDHLCSLDRALLHQCHCCYRTSFLRSNAALHCEAALRWPSTTIALPLPLPLPLPFPFWKAILAFVQAISTAEQSFLHTNRHLLSCVLPLLLQAAVEPNRGQHLQPCIWAPQVVGSSHPVWQCSHSVGQRQMACRPVSAGYHAVSDMHKDCVVSSSRESHLRWIRK